MSSAPQLVNLVASTETMLGKAPFSVGNQVAAHSTAGATLYGVNRPGAYNANNYIDQPDVQNIFVADIDAGTQDGTDVTFDAADFPALANLSTAVVSDANRLANVVILKGTDGRVLNILTQIALAGNPAAGQFSVTAGATNVLKLGEIDLVNDPTGYIVEVWMTPVADIKSVAVAAGVNAEIECSEVMLATAATQLQRLGAS